MEWPSSSLKGSTKKTLVMQRKMTEIHPMGMAAQPRLKVLFLNVFLDTVSLHRIGIA
jgi:hypothetical protein